MVVGILALQGGVDAHRHVLHKLGLSPKLVRRPEDVKDLDALILPGGESTTLNKLLDIFSMRPALQRAVQELPVLGTCAGLILLAQLGALDVDVRRNAFGPQLHSTAATLTWGSTPVQAAFIRAPEITRVGPNVEVMSRWEGRVVGVRATNAAARPVVGLSYHPELAEDATVHRELVKHSLSP